MLEIALEVVALAVLLYLLLATFEPLQTRTFKRTLGPALVLVIRILVIVGAIALLARILMASGMF